MWDNFCIKRFKNRVDSFTRSKVVSKSLWGYFYPPLIRTERAVKIIGMTMVNIYLNSSCCSNDEIEDALFSYKETLS